MTTSRRDHGARTGSRGYARRGIAVSNETIRVMLVDDHALIREGLRVLLRRASDIIVIGEAGDGVEALDLVTRLLPDVVVLDLGMPRSDGATALAGLHRVVPQVHVLILTMYDESDRLLPLLQAGASGFITKDAASQELIDAIRVVASGDVYVRPTAARLLASALSPAAATATAHSRFRELSDREQTVLRSVAQGYSGVEISRTLGVSTKTVDAYKRRIENKLGLSHRTDYVRFGIEAGILGSSIEL